MSKISCSIITIGDEILYGHILDTNSNPEGIDFPIPGNDDARRSIDLYCNLMKDTINDAKNNIKSLNDNQKKEEKIEDIINNKKKSDKNLN